MNMPKILEPFSFSFGVLQDISTLFKRLDVYNLSPDDFISYVDNLKRQYEEVKIEHEEFNKKAIVEWKKKALYCPECDSTMIPFPVNVSPSTQVDKQYNSVWICSNKTCMETIYTPDTIHDIIKAATKDVTNGITSNAGGG